MVSYPHKQVREYQMLIRYQIFDAILINIHVSLMYIQKIMTPAFLLFISHVFIKHHFFAILYVILWAPHPPSPHPPDPS